MTQERLNLAIMSIESDILCEIDFTAFINDFAVAKSRKVPGLWLKALWILFVSIRYDAVSQEYQDKIIVII